MAANSLCGRIDVRASIFDCVARNNCTSETAVDYGTASSAIN
jgi:hypothetical protein